MSTPIEYSRVVQELDTVIDDRDDALRQVAAARTQMATVRAAIEALCVESEQVRRSSRALPGVEPMIYVRDVRALLTDGGAAALREHDLHVISDAEQRMFGTTDPGEFIETADGIPVSEFQRLLWEPYRDTAGEAGHA